MKRGIFFSICLLAFAGALTILMPGCKKKNSEPVLVTFPVLYISQQSVSCEGAVIDDGGADVTERGICWGLSQNPTTSNNKNTCGSGTGSFSCTINGLLVNTQYYLRSYAINSAGIGYGPQITFRTWNAEVVTDIDGNTYHTVTIGAQVWLVENLKVTKYRNGDQIPEVTDYDQWGLLTSGGYCNYENNQGNGAIYGRLYNWYTINDSRNIAPDGWRVASDEDWWALSDFLGGEIMAGGKLKEAGLSHWKEPNAGATNETGFSALPGGHRDYAGIFDYIQWGGGWWTSTEGNPNDAYVRYVDYGAYDLWRSLEDKRYGRSVRCIKE